MLHSASSFSRTTLSLHPSRLSNPPPHPSTKSTPPPLQSWIWCSSQTSLLGSYSTSLPSSSHILRGSHTSPVPFSIHRRISVLTTEQLALATHKAQQHRSSSSSSIHTWSSTHRIENITTSNHISNNRCRNKGINNNNDDHRNRCTEHPSFLGPILLLDDLCNRLQILQQTTHPSYAMFSSPMASIANLASTRSRSPLAHENSFRGRQYKSRTRKGNKPKTKSTLSVVVPQGSPCSASLLSVQSDKKPEETSMEDTLSQERSCSPVTPLPSANTVLDAYSPLTSPLDGASIIARMISNHSAHAESIPNSTSTGPTTPRSRPKPSPIATKALRRSTSLGSRSATINALVPEPMDGEGLTSSPNSTGNHLNKECLPDEDEDCQSGRDSGIAIEPWSRTSPEPDKNSFISPKDPFPSFDQLFQSSDFGLTGNTPMRRIEIPGYSVPTTWIANRLIWMLYL